MSATGINLSSPRARAQTCWRRSAPAAPAVAKNPIPPTIWSYNDAVEDDPYDPEQNVQGAVRYLDWLERNYWGEKIADPQERLKFILASYNAGAGHEDTEDEAGRERRPHD